MVGLITRFYETSFKNHLLFLHFIFGIIFNEFKFPNLCNLTEEMQPEQQVVKKVRKPPRRKDNSKLLSNSNLDE